MLNQIILVGRLTKDPEDKNITIAVPRSYKNEEGIYDTDFININVFDKIAENTKDYCRKGDIIGVKGRIETNEDKMIIKAEKITFLSSNNKKEEENE